MGDKASEPAISAIIIVLEELMHIIIMSGGCGMYIFVCEDRFEDMMSCIYQAWEKALKVGHGCVRLERCGNEQPSLFDEYIHVDFNEDEYNKVVRSIKQKISNEAYACVYYACLSSEQDALDAAYRFLVIGFKAGAAITYMRTEPSVMRIKDIRRRVINEARYFREFARFNSVDGKVYVCHLEPKSDVIYEVAQHFADRMPSENWLIIDDNRSKAVIHPIDGEMYIRYLTDYEIEALSGSEAVNDEYTDMWKAFFETIAIKQRNNEKCQRNLMPLWMRKHVTEFH